ncbi:hypothetical protein QBK93_35940 [Rhizobium leguminosarum]|uniref:hypothetical protein n=1 Tax=Rhizobium leguminosarum TaxID=384 RepID=UPI0024A9BE87|nr:hypothetical protein [Rhizobium leguminosarum]MDI5929995.1 hypothetical protein [Rhizobium leguminosarum]
MDREYAKIMIDYLYDEGDRYIIFFGDILGIVSYGREDTPFDKSPSARFFHAVKLAEFLVHKRDFSPGISVRQEDGGFRNTFYEGGFEKFCEDLNCRFNEGGIDNIDLIAGPWLTCH